MKLTYIHKAIFILIFAILINMIAGISRLRDTDETTKTSDTIAAVVPVRNPNHKKVVLPNEDILVKKKYEIPNKIMKSNKEVTVEVSRITDSRTQADAEGGVILGLLLFFILYFFMTASIYCQNDKGSYVVLGRSVVWKKGGMYQVKITQRIINKSESFHYKIIFHKFFSDRNKHCKVVIVFEHRKINRKIEKELFIYLKNQKEKGEL